jgi:hypothetical protein
MQPIAEPVDVERLDLDPENPRLPELVQGSSQSALLSFLYENDVLEELIESYISNGYFPAEPMLVLPPDQDGRRLVVEGNRRLAALMILLQLPPAVEAGIRYDAEPPPPPESLDRLRHIPVVEIESRGELSDYLGFRHISGLKAWEPEAKARWLYRQVEQARQDGSADPFYEVGRRVGSNARGVRSAYNSYNILRYGRDELQLNRADVNYVMKERFGVWTRLLGTANVPRYIGIQGNAGTYEAVRQQVEQLDPAKFAEVVSDLVPSRPGGKAVLQDSRDATEYSTVIADDRARETLRRYGDLRLAREVAEQGEIRNRLKGIVSSIESVTLDVARYTITQPDVEAAEEVLGSARVLRGAVAGAIRGDDE